MKVLYVFFSTVVAICFVAGAYLNPIVRSAVQSIGFAVVMVAAAWFLYQLEVFVQGYKSRIFEMVHEESDSQV